MSESFGRYSPRRDDHPAGGHLHGLKDGVGPRGMDRDRDRPQFNSLPSGGGSSVHIPGNLNANMSRERSPGAQARMGPGGVGSNGMRVT
jgi:hypothetical protein